MAVVLEEEARRFDGVSVVEQRGSIVDVIKDKDGIGFQSLCFAAGALTGQKRVSRRLSTLSCFLSYCAAGERCGKR